MQEYARYAKELAEAGVARAGAKLAPSGTVDAERIFDQIADELAIGALATLRQPTVLAAAPHEVGSGVSSACRR